MVVQVFLQTFLRLLDSLVVRSPLLFSLVEGIPEQSGVVCNLDTVRVGQNRPQPPLEDLLPNFQNVEDEDGGGGGDTQKTESSLLDASFGLQLCAHSDLRFSDEFFNDVFKHVTFLLDVAELTRSQYGWRVGLRELQSVTNLPYQHVSQENLVRQFTGANNSRDLVLNY